MYKLTQSTEDYLEAIYVLERDGHKIKSSKIAEMLSVSKPAVNKAMSELSDKGMITKESYGDINLTDIGREQAHTIYDKHVVLKSLLTKIGVSEDTAEIDCCKLEHALSEETYQCLLRLLDRL